MQESTVENFCEWIDRIQSEYAEMPGLHLTTRQAQRLWNLDRESAEAIFEMLESVHFLKRLANDTYIRGDVG